MLDGLTLGAQPGALTQNQQPYCDVAQRVQPAERWAYRYPQVGLGGAFVVPPEYVLSKRIEYRVAGAAAYEITMLENVGWRSVPFALRAGTTIDVAEGVSGIARFRVESGGFNAGRFHHGRQTLVVASEVCQVDLLRPATSVLLQTQPMPVPTDEESNAVVIVDVSIRIVAVPARSRRPSQWRIADLVQTGIGFPRLAFAPGVSDVRVLGASAAFATGALAMMPTGLGGPVIPLTTGDLSGWTPTDGASHLILDGDENGAPLIVEQRGWI